MEITPSLSSKHKNVISVVEGNHSFMKITFLSLLLSHFRFSMYMKNCFNDTKKVLLIYHSLIFDRMHFYCSSKLQSTINNCEMNKKKYKKIYKLIISSVNVDIEINLLSLNVAASAAVEMIPEERKRITFFHHINKYTSKDIVD